MSDYKQAVKFIDQANDIRRSKMFIFLVIFLYLIQLVLVKPASTEAFNSRF